MSLPTLYQSYIHMSKYSRFMDQASRRELWPETVHRYFDFFTDFLQQKHGLDVSDHVPDLYDAVHDLESMPSMRALMTAGPALARDHIAGYNPVSGATEVLTREHGVVPIRTLANRSATVVNREGRWASADFRFYGRQPLKRVRLRLNSNTERHVDCTENHRWVLQDGRVLSTKALRQGDRIDFVAAPKPEMDDDYRLGVIHGLVYGDGTVVKSHGRIKGYHIRLCSDADDLIPWFEGYPVCRPPSFGGDPVMMLYDSFAKTHDLKSLPSRDETESYLLGFVRGWLAADGTVSAASQVSLCVRDRDREWLRTLAPKVGFVVQHEKRQNRCTNLGERREDSWVIYFSRSSCVPEDFLIDRKRERFRSLDSHYVVSEVIDLGEEAEVFCAEVPDTNTFTLAGGLVTGNCAYREIDSTKAFAEIMFILMCGTGISWSVERQVIKKLPKVPDTLQRDNGHCIHVRDSKRGWASAIRELLQALYNGKVPSWDTTKVRPYGARLKKMGGRASGPEPLIDAFKFIVHTFDGAKGRQLNSTECHDIACVISDAVVVGGVRRAAALSLSNLSDQRMRDAKTGAWWETTLFRRLANNSVAYTERPEVGQFMQEWMSLYESKSGERGMFNREAARNQAMKSGRRRGFWDQPLGQWTEDGRFFVPALIDYEEFWQAPIAFGTNPCAEIILRSEELCNLSSPIARPHDTIEDLERKVRNAAIMGTWQACLTDFRFVGEKWRRNCEEERLLGVSLSGMMDCPLLNDRHDPDLPERLEHLKLAAVDENIKWAKELGINPAAAVTCVKPEGNSSQLVASASGIHPEYAHKYIRRVRQSTQDPLTQFMIDKGFVGEPERGKEDRTMVFSFPRRIADEAMTRDDMTAIDQLEHWKIVQDHYCEHKPSITVYVREHEWPEVGAWAWKHFDELSGVSFLPFDGGSYHQAPYEEVGEEELQKLEAAMPQNVDWSELGRYESTDNTTGSRELACTSGACEIR